MSEPALSELAARVLTREPRAVARAMRMVDDRLAGYADLLKEIFPKTGRAFVVGITGNPGAGKSTLTDALIETLRAAGKTVGVIAVDPTSPFSGGAILGDRIRMQRHAEDEGVFIRSVATRGHLGGLSRSARDMVRVLDAAGFDVILVETVGVGQDELEITRTAHTTLVVMAPGMGDDVQAIKAGLLECADVFAVNKADREGADATVRDLELMIALGKESMLSAHHSGRAAGLRALGGRGHATNLGDTEAARMQKEEETRIAKSTSTKETWVPPILKSIATKKAGIAEIVAALDAHHAWLVTSEAGAARREARLGEEMREALREALIDAAVADLGHAVDEAAHAVAERKIDPYSAIENLVTRFRARP